MAKVSNEYLPLSVLGIFPADWAEATLAEVCNQVTDGTHDSPKSVAAGGYPLVTGKAIKDRRIDFSVTYNISDAEHQKVIGRSKPECNDILFANIGNSIGDLVRVQTSRPFSIKNVALFKPNQAKITARYLEYFLLSKQVQKFIKGTTRGSAQPFIGLSSLRGFPIALPSLAEQLSIGTLLGSLDDRIALLRETNATLEAIAQALFKSWFVDFDPVRAKMEGRVPEGMDEATAALFPDGLEESELGAVPRGWTVGVLGDILKLRNERVQPSENTASLPYVPIESISAKIPFLQEFKSGQEANSSLTLFYKGDVLFGAMRPYFHKVCSAPFDGVTRTTVFTLTPVNPNMGFFALFQAYQDSIIEYATQHSEGSTIPYAKWRNSMELMPLFIPAESIQMAFSAVVSSFVERANLNVLQAQNLAALRDTLLPRLISGQLRLPDVEAQIDAISA